jgi:alkylhydroperoxidase family enzyme
LSFESTREDLALAHERAWAAIAAPGTWLSGERRVAVAAEIRHAHGCEHCARIQAALSPQAVQGEHVGLGALGAPEVELIHRVVCDPGRLSEPWSRSVLARGLSEGEYVEIVGLVAMVMMMDRFAQALGLPERALPAPQGGAPTRYRPAGAKKQAAWLPLVEPEDALEADGPMYPSPKAGYIYRALSLVPQSLRDYWALANTHYLPGQFVYQFDKSIRAISRPQMEIMAARVSALHQCVY